MGEQSKNEVQRRGEEIRREKYEEIKKDGWLKRDKKRKRIKVMRNRSNSKKDT